LVESGKNDSGYCQAKSDASDEALGGKPSYPLEEGGGNLRDLDGEIGGHMPADQKQNGRGSEGDRHRVRQAPRLTEIDHQVDDREQVAEQPVEQSQPFDRLEIVPAENFNRGPQHEAGG